MKSIKGFLRTRSLEKRFNQKPIVVESKVEDFTIKFIAKTWIEYNNRAKISFSGEPDMIHFLNDSLKEKDIFWDIGSNVGAFSLYAAKKIKSSKIFAIEPYIPTFNDLWENITLNKLEKNITPICCGLSNISQEEILGINDPQAGSSHNFIGKSNGILSQPVITVKGDDLIRFFKIPSPNIIKIDVDGFEIEVLDGMKRVLYDSSLRSVIIEVEKHNTEDSVVKIMEDAKFKKISDSRNKENPTTFNVIFHR